MEMAVPQYELDDIREAREDRDLAEDRLDLAVAIARDKGDSWEAIGRALGVAKQSAWEKYGKSFEEPHPPAS